MSGKVKSKFLRFDIPLLATYKYMDQEGFIDFKSLEKLLIQSQEFLGDNEYLVETEEECQLILEAVRKFQIFGGFLNSCAFVTTKGPVEDYFKQLVLKEPEHYMTLDEHLKMFTGDKFEFANGYFLGPNLKFNIYNSEVIKKEVEEYNDALKNKYFDLANKKTTKKPLEEEEDKKQSGVATTQQTSQVTATQETNNNTKKEIVKEIEKDFNAFVIQMNAITSIYTPEICHTMIATTGAFDPWPLIIELLPHISARFIAVCNCVLMMKKKVAQTVYDKMVSITLLNGKNKTTNKTLIRSIASLAYFGDVFAQGEGRKALKKVGCYFTKNLPSMVMNTKQNFNESAADYAARLTKMQLGSANFKEGWKNSMKNALKYTTKLDDVITKRTKFKEEIFQACDEYFSLIFKEKEVTEEEEED